MSYIFPPCDQRHFELKAELRELGGEDKVTFRFGIAWDGEHYFDLTENDSGHELYDAWISAHGGTPLPWDNEADTGDDTTPEESDSTPVFASDSHDDTDTDTDVNVGDTDADATAPKSTASKQKNTQQSATEPPAESTQDDAAAANEPTDTTQENGPALESTSDSQRDDVEPSEVNKSSGSTPSGTTRKRSAKNSSRRS